MPSPPPATLDQASGADPMTTGDRRGFLGMLGVGMAVCCGSPLLAGTGMAAALAGVSLESWPVVVSGLVVAIVGLAAIQHRRRQTRATRGSGSNDACCATDAPTALAVDHTRERQ